MPDIPQLTDMDDGFVGVNSRVDPSLLDRGFVSEAINRKFENSVISNRWGVIQPKWGGLWNETEKSGLVTSGSAGVSGIDPVDAGFPVNAIVACDKGAGTLVFPSGTRVLSMSGGNTNATMSTAAISFGGSPATFDFSWYSSTSPVPSICGIMRYRDQFTGTDSLLVASNDDRSDGGQGRVYLIKPNQAHQEIPMNGHDFYDEVRFVQCGDAVVLLRPGNARYYFPGSSVDGSSDEITLNVIPDLKTGDRVTVTSIGSAPPLWTASTSSGQGFGLYVNVLGDTLTLHLTESDARSKVSSLDLSSSLSSSNRYYIELSGNPTNYDISNEIEIWQNGGRPLIMQNGYSSGQIVSTDNGFDRVPDNLSAVSASSYSDELTIPNHNFVDGDQVTVSNSTIGGVSDGIYYATSTGTNTIVLHFGDTEETDSLVASSRAYLSATITAGAVTGVEILNAGSGYLVAPEITVSGGSPSTPSEISCTITDGKISAVSIDVAGSGYGSAPTLEVAMPNTLVDVTGSGTATIRKSSASGASIPAGRLGVYFQNRLLMVYGNDTLAVSDILDPLHYSQILSEYRLNSGTNDRVVSIVPFNSTTLVILKQRSVLAIENLYGDLSSVRLTEVTREFGCVAKDSVINTGSDLVFLSQRGVISLQQTQFGIAQSVVIPLSDAIQSDIDTIDESRWQYSTAAYYRNRYLLAAPVEGGDGTNSRVFSFNFLNKAWEGYWEGSLLRPVQFERIYVAGVDTLVFSDASGFIHAFDSVSLTDRAVSGTSYQIETSVKFRGFTAGQTEHKQWTDVAIELASWNPRYSITVEFDGVNEQQTLSTDQTKSRAAYYRYGSAPFVTNNSGDNFLNPYREDYSTTASLSCGSNGWKAGLHQTFMHKARVRGHASSISPKLTSDRGSIDITNCKVVGIPFRLYGKNDV